MTLTLQAGKFYRRQSGRKAWVAGRSPFGGRTPWIGATEGGGPHSWTDDGRFISRCEEPCAKDLIAEWTEPRSGEVWCNIYPPHSGGGWIYTSRQGADEAADKIRRIACIRVPWTEGQFDV